MKTRNQTPDRPPWQQAGDVLLVTDIQNDFRLGGSLAVAGGDAVVPVLDLHEFTAAVDCST